jgi:serine/threonine-protein kinase
LTVGTPAYLSPEQAVGGEIKPASDLYSTTIVLFEMIVGHPPFEDKDPLAMLGAHVSRPPPRISEAVPGLAVPDALEDLIQRGLAKTSAERISSAAEYLSYVDGIAPPGAPQPMFASEVGTPLPAMALGHAPTATLTPVPAHATPVPAHLTPAPAHATPLPTHATPLPTHATPLPMSTRPISLADAPPIPRNWIKVGAVVVAALVIIAVLVALAGGGGGDGRKLRAPTKPEPKAAAPEPAPEKTVAPSPPPAPIQTAIVDLVTPGPDPAVRFEALVAKLKRGKTCAERKAAVEGLEDLGDAKAIPHLRRARYRMRGGLAGIGASNTNACLKAAAEAAIKQLGGTVK